MKLLFFALAALFSVSFAQAKNKAVICKDFDQIVSQGKQSEKLKKFFELQWKVTMEYSPEYATYVGIPDYNDRWTDSSLAAIQERKEIVHCEREALLKISRKALSDFDKVSYDLNLKKMDEIIEAEKFPGDYLVLDQMGGVHMNISDILWAMPKANVKDFENMLERLRKAPNLIDQNIALLKEGLRQKVTPAQVLLKKIPAQFDDLMPPSIDDSPIYKPFLESKSIPQADQDRIKAAAQSLIKKELEPALRKLKVFIEKEYIPGARQGISWSEMPNGKAWYAFSARVHTTTQQTPEDFHNLGLREVNRILIEMEKVKTQVKFSGDLKAFNKFLLTDKKFYYDNPKDLMVGYRDIAKRIDPELPKLFKTLPRLTYGVREMPSYKAPAAPTAYYQPGSPAGGRAGSFEANTYDLKARPKWGMEALTIHEAVPGHHLQIALAQEIEGLPEFRKNEGPTAFVEGWGLYAESLGEDMGFYADPYSKYGQLAYEMWRAVRLVVDTGMHYYGWSREKALTYYMDHIPKAQSESEAEIDRYIAWPGQALAYKVGQLKFQELRAKAQKILGDKFDVRLFHDEVLRHGAIPLDVLEKAFDRWIEAQQKKVIKG